MIANADLLLQSSNFETIIIHPGVVYSEESGAFSRFTSHQSKIEVWGRHDARWPLVHTDDLAVAYRLILENGQEGESYNACAETGIRQSELVNEVLKQSINQPTIHYRPTLDLIIEHGSWASGFELDQQMSSEKIRRSLGWSPKYENGLDLVAQIRSI